MEVSKNLSYSIVMLLIGFLLLLLAAGIGIANIIPPFKETWLRVLGSSFGLFFISFSIYIETKSRGITKKNKKITKPIYKHDNKLAKCISQRIDKSSLNSKFESTKYRTNFKLFLSSPKDVDEEKLNVKKIIYDLSSNFFKKEGLKIELIEEEFAPEFPPDIDVYIGILGQKFAFNGKFGSGTEKEFLSIFDDWKIKKHPEVLFYFKDIVNIPTASTAEESKQWTKILHFKEELGPFGISWTFKNSTDLITKLSNHLPATIQKLSTLPVIAFSKDYSPFITIPPRTFDEFFGREEELEYIKNALTFYPHGYKIMVISGPGGIGKSALVNKLAHDYFEVERYDFSSDIYFNSIIYVSAQEEKITSIGPKISDFPILKNLNDIYRAIAKSLHCDDIMFGKYENDKLERVKKVLLERKILLIIDNFENIIEMEDKTIENFISNLPDTTKIIIASRWEVDIIGSCRIPLEKMKDDDIRKFIEYHCEKNKVRKLSKKEIETICEVTGNNPGAIELILARLYYESDLEKILEKHLDPTREIARFYFEKSVRMIRNKFPEYNLLKSLSLLSTSADRNMLGEVANLKDEDAVNEGLEKIQRLHLANLQSGRFYMEYANKKYILNEFKNDEKNQFYTRMINFYKNFLKRHTSLVDMQADFKKQEIEFKNIFGILDFCYENNRMNDYCELIEPLRALILERYCHKQEYWPELEEYYLRGVKAATYIKNDIALTRLKLAVGNFHYFQRRWNSAEEIADEVHKFAKKNNIVESEIEALKLKGISIKEVGIRKKDKNKVIKSSQIFIEAIEKVKHLKDSLLSSHLKHTIEGNLSSALKHIGEYEEELKSLEKALQIIRKHVTESRSKGDPIQINIDVGRLGDIYRVIGELEMKKGKSKNAEENFEQSEKYLDEAIKDNIELERSIDHLGHNDFYMAKLKHAQYQLKRSISDYDMALNKAKEAYNIFDNIGDEGKKEEIKNFINKIESDRLTKNKSKGNIIL